MASGLRSSSIATSGTRMILTFLQALALAAAAPLPPTGTINLAQSDDRVYVMMRIGQDEIVPMIFDTGSDGHSIDRSLVARHRLRTVGTTIEIDGSTQKRRSLRTVAIPDVALGGMRVGTIRAVALDYDRDDAMGIISSEMFAGRLLMIDLAHNRATLLDKATAALPAAPATPYVGALPATLLTLPDGTTLPAELDSGYNAPLSLPVAMLGRVRLAAPAKVVGRFHSINSDGDVMGGRIEGPVKIGPITLDSPDVVFLGDVANVGLPVIRRGRLLLDSANHRSWFLANP